MEKENRLLEEMIQYYAGDPMRIQHFIKVYEFSRLIGSLENIEDPTMTILKTAAIVHDIGIRYCEQEFGKCNGKMQEQYGPALAKEMLNRMGYDNDMIDRVCYLVGHHHTYTDMDGIDYQILVEADFLVNLYEDNESRSAVNHAYQKIFKTETGKKICRNMYQLEYDINIDNI